ncbi:MAG TPA: hypothetical protein VK587_10825 [bacterium]|nr:hypothetical protein [bacterium]
MTTAKGRLETSSPHAGAKPPRPGEGTGCLARDVLAAGFSLAMVPVNMLPDEPRAHLKTAVRELALALASLSRTMADALETLSRESEEKPG